MAKKTKDEALAEVREARANRKALEEAYVETDTDFKVKIRQALRAGATVSEVYVAAGVSRERVYQIRDDRSR